MNKKKLWLIIGAAIAALAILIGVLCYLYWPGYRVVADRLYVDVEKTGFVFDPETGEILGETPVLVRGTATSAHNGVFSGEVEVLGYQNYADGTIVGEGTTERAKDGTVLIHYLENCTHYQDVELEDYKAATGVTEKVTHLCDYYYTVCLYPEDGEFVAVEIGDFEEESLVYVICAKTESQAKERYEWYVKNR